MSEHSGNRAGELCRALILMVADLAFIELEEESRGEQAEIDAECLKMKLSVLHPITGELFLAMEPGLLREITCNIYGFDEEKLTRDNELDMLAELLNTIAGQFMQVIIPPTVRYELGLPLLLEGDEALTDNNDMSFVFRSEKGRLVLSVVGQKLTSEVMK